MKCPVDDAELLMTDRQGIEIDYCPKCRGVWLDRGELDKLIERAGASTSSQASMHSSRSNDHYDDDDQDFERRRQSHDYEHNYKDRDGHHGDYDPHHKKHKKEGFLGDLFDF
jgi:uncharacterized protein